MAVAPALPWRKASTGVLLTGWSGRRWARPAVLAVAVVIGCRASYRLSAFGLGGFAITAALRQLVLATRRGGGAAWSVGRTAG